MNRNEYVMLQGRKLEFVDSKGTSCMAVVTEIDFDIGITLEMESDFYSNPWCINRELETTDWTQGKASHKEIDKDIDWAANCIIAGKLDMRLDPAYVRGHALPDIGINLTTQCAFK